MPCKHDATVRSMLVLSFFSKDDLDIWLCLQLWSALACHFCYIWWVLHMNMSSSCVLVYAMPSLQGCLPCIFVIFVVTSTSMQSSLPDIANFRISGFWLSHFPAVIFMPCIHDALVRSMLVLSIFSKDDLDIWLCSIHPCPCLNLWSTLAWLNLALLLL